MVIVVIKMGKSDIQFSEYLRLRRQSNPAAIERIKAMDKVRRNAFEHYANMIGGGVVYPAAHSKGGE